MCLVPVFVVVFFSGIDNAHAYAAAIYALAGITDVLDGIIARKFNLITRLGKILDPLADKMMTITVFVCLSFSNIIKWWVIALIFAKDILLIAGGVKLYKEMSGVVGGVSILLFDLQSPLYKNIFSGGAITLSLLAFFSYLYQYCKFQKTHDTTQF